jgi:hypothetical protein
MAATIDAYDFLGVGPNGVPGRVDVEVGLIRR